MKPVTTEASDKQPDGEIDIMFLSHLLMEEQWRVRLGLKKVVLHYSEPLASQ